jgi:hypothetical protein
MTRGIGLYFSYVFAVGALEHSQRVQYWYFFGPRVKKANSIGLNKIMSNSLFICNQYQRFRVVMCSRNSTSFQFFESEMPSI